MERTENLIMQEDRWKPDGSQMEAIKGDESHGRFPI